MHPSVLCQINYSMVLLLKYYKWIRPFIVFYLYNLLKAAITFNDSTRILNFVMGALMFLYISFVYISWHSFLHPLCILGCDELHNCNFVSLEILWVKFNCSCSLHKIKMVALDSFNRYTAIS